MRLIVSLAIVLITSTAASAAPLAPDKHAPPLWLDPTSIWVNLVGKGDSGYDLHSWFRIYGASSKTDRFRVEVKQGGKLLGTAKCINIYEADTSLHGGCNHEKELSAKGPLELQLIYTDDQDSKDYLVSTLKVDVRRWPSIGKSIDWGYVPDDVLALGYLRHVDDNVYSKLPNFEFWTTTQIMGTTTLRCSVDGKKLPDFDAEVNNHVWSSQDEISSVWTTPKGQKAYRFIHIGVNFKWTEYGPKPAQPNSAYRYLVDNPGKWDCLFRSDGKPVRQFLFTVNAKGMVEPSEMQTAAKVPFKLTPDVVLIDMRIPKDSVETRIRPDALKKGIGWGLPWPDSPKAKEAQAAFPPAMGTPD